MNRRVALSVVVGMGLAAGLAGAARMAVLRMGRQPDGSFVVSSGQRVEGGSIAFAGRPIDLALHPSGEFFAVMAKTGVFLGSKAGVRPESNVPLGAEPGFRGLVWTPDGRRLLASTARGPVRVFAYAEGRLSPEAWIIVKPDGTPGNPVPGGMAVTRDSSTLFVASANRNAVVEVDLDRLERTREFPVENVPFEVRLSEDEQTLIATNWGGRRARPGDTTGKSQDLDLVVDERNTTTSGTVSLIDRQTGAAVHLEVGLHPTAVAVAGGRAYVANAMSDSISEIDLGRKAVARTFPMRWGSLRVLGGMPNALAVRGRRLYVADGGDNAVGEVDLDSGAVLGYRHAGYFPTAIALAPDGKAAYVLNTKGNGSVDRRRPNRPAGVHDFQGTVTVVDLEADLARETKLVARNNRWETPPARPALKVYQGAIRHVLYIIKENRTYDEVFGDLPEGDGDPKLCSLGETVMPNHRKLAREFTLFDNGYVSGTNSADGHAWSTQSMANEYLEHFYLGYSRSYPCEGEDPMAISTAGTIWDAALDKGKTLRVWGEFCNEEKAVFEPMPRNWFEVWEDRLKKTGRFKLRAATDIPRLRPHINPEVHYWPLLQSDQFRADVFIREYREFSRKGQVPHLMILSLPCDHGEGMNERYPTPRAMMADNDLALGRVVEAVSASPQWKETCIFVIEDDAQSGPDHVDGHRTVFLAISPYNRRRTVDSTFYTTINMLRSIELMLGLDPLTRFDALADPLVACFADTLDPTPYVAVPNRVPLDERNPSGRAMTDADRFWTRKTAELDWSHIDGPDPYWLNRINWYSLHRGRRPYPDRPGEAPGQDADD